MSPAPLSGPLPFHPTEEDLLTKAWWITSAAQTGFLGQQFRNFKRAHADFAREADGGGQRGGCGHRRAGLPVLRFFQFPLAYVVLCSLGGIGSFLGKCAG